MTMPAMDRSPYRLGARARAMMLATCVAGAACATTAKAPPPEPVRPLTAEPGVDCAAMRALADSAPAIALADTTYIRPAPTRVFLPDPELMRRVHGRVTYTVPIDTAGTAELSQARLDGVNDLGARRDFQNMLARISYRPAHLHGCAVLGVATLAFDIP